MDAKTREAWKMAIRRIGETLRDEWGDEDPVAYFWEFYSGTPDVQALRALLDAPEEAPRGEDCHVGLHVMEIIPGTHVVFLSENGVIPAPWACLATCPDRASAERIAADLREYFGRLVKP